MTINIALIFLCVITTVSASFLAIANHHKAALAVAFIGFLSGIASVVAALINQNPLPLY